MPEGLGVVSWHQADPQGFFLSISKHSSQIEGERDFFLNCPGICGMLMPRLCGSMTAMRMTITMTSIPTTRGLVKNDAN